MTDTTPSHYVRHAAGMADLLTWLSRWERFQDSFTVRDHALLLGTLPSRRFSIGVPKSRLFGSYPFLALQAEEEAWVGRMQWARAVVRTGERRLYLVSERSLGDDDRLPDIPAFAVALEFDLDDKVAILGTSRRLEARSLWFDPDFPNVPMVSNGPPLWSIPLKVVEPDAPVLQPSETSDDRSFRSLVQAKIEHSNRMERPVFVGEASVIDDPELQKLLQPFDPTSIGVVRPRDGDQGKRGKGR